MLGHFSDWIGKRASQVMRSHWVLFGLFWSSHAIALQVCNISYNATIRYQYYSSTFIFSYENLHWFNKIYLKYVPTSTMLLAIADKSSQKKWEDRFNQWFICVNCFLLLVIIYYSSYIQLYIAILSFLYVVNIYLCRLQSLE